MRREMIVDENQMREITESRVIAGDSHLISERECVKEKNNDQM